MTKRIYIRGDVSDPLTLRLYDADTAKPVNVTSLEIIMEVNKASRIRVTELTPGQIKSRSYFADLVPGPPCAAAGKVLKEVELRQERRQPPQAPCYSTIMRATSTEWTVQDDGTVQSSMATRYTKEHAVDDITLAKYGGDPKDILEDAARLVLTDIVQHTISRMMGPARTGGAVPSSNPFKSGTVPPAAFPINSPVTQKSAPGKKPNSNSKASCAECGGSGEYISQITNKKSDCSRGCKRP